MQPSELKAAGLHVFPCWIRWDEPKQKWLKGPVTVDGESWQATGRRAIDDPAVDWSGGTHGLEIPPGVMLLDGDHYKDGASREQLEAVLGCALPWDLALVQTTVSGGCHYAFKAPDYDVRQGSAFYHPDRPDVRTQGLDTRVAGKGFICIGDGYTEVGPGIVRLAYPEHLPELPDAVRPFFEHVEQTAPARVTTYGDSVDELRKALAVIPPDLPRDGGWLEVAMAIKSYYALDPTTGYSLFDEWCSGELGGFDTPANYDVDDNAKQWDGIKSERTTGTTIHVGTAFHVAKQYGYEPPQRDPVDTAGAFAVSGTTEDHAALLAHVQATGGDLTQLEELTNRIDQSGCSDMQRAVLVAALKQALKDTGAYTRGLGLQIDRDLASVGGRTSLPAAMPTLMDVNDLTAAPLSNATSVHSHNARLMHHEVFGGRLGMHNGGLRWWSGREWQRMPEDLLLRLTLDALMPLQAKVPNAAGTITALKAHCAAVPACPADTRVYLQDCVVDVRTGMQQPHSPDNGNLGCMAVTRGNGAPTAWLQFLDSLFGGLSDGLERIALLQEVMGWALIRDTLNLQKIIAFDGASRAGKGVILEMLTAMMSPGSVGTFTFGDLDSGKTQSKLRHFDLVVDTDAKAPDRRGSKAALAFLNKVTSNEVVSIELLNNQETYEGRLDCKMLIACNGIPTMIDDSGASTNRFMVLYFTRTFEGREDRELLSRLKYELQEVAGWALDGASRLLRNGGTFTEPVSSREAVRELKGINQPMLDFIEEWLVFDVTARVCTGELWHAYKTYCAEAGLHSGNVNTFGRGFKQSIVGRPAEYHNGTMRQNGYRGSGWIGMRLADRSVGSTVGAFKPEVVAGTSS